MQEDIDRRRLDMPKRWTAYVLKSLRDGQNYVGMTCNLSEQLHQHESGKTKTPRSRGPFQAMHTEEFPTRGEARAREKYFKTSAGRRFLKEHVSCHPESRGFPARPNELAADDSVVRRGGGVPSPALRLAQVFGPWARSERAPPNDNGLALFAKSLSFCGPSRGV